MLGLQNIKSVKIISLLGMVYVKIIKRLSDYCKECKKMHGDHKWCLEYVKVREKYFIFEWLKFEK